jgi:hypothetical protein
MKLNQKMKGRTQVLVHKAKGGNKNTTEEQKELNRHVLGLWLATSWASHGNEGLVRFG